MKSKASAKVLDILRTVFVIVVIAMAVIMLIFTLVSVNTMDKEDIDIFGYKFFIVKSDSMKATDFAAGDIIISKIVDPRSLKDGDIITFYDPTVVGNPGSDGERVVTHKIRYKTTTEDGDHAFQTYGTTKDINDPFVVPYSHILGQYQFSLPKVGYLFAPENRVPVYIVFIFIPFMLLILSQGISFVRTFLKFRKEQKAIIAAERAKLDEERATALEEQRKAQEEQRRMMEELLALKKQLADQGGQAQATADAPEAEATQPAEVAQATDAPVENEAVEASATVVDNTSAENNG